MCKSCLFIIGIISIFLTSLFAAPGAQLPLDGTWDFKLDPADAGVKERWFESSLSDKIQMPGSTDERGFGTKVTQPEMTRLTRTYTYVGPAWYQKEVIIPSDWKGKHIELFLERCHWETQVWVDGTFAGVQNSLCVPHIYDLSKLLTPGSHKLAIRVDNTYKIDIGGWAHAITDETQTNWNGIIGQMELRATEPVRIESVAIYPDFKSQQMKVKITIINNQAGEIKGKLNLEITQDKTAKALIEKTVDFAAKSEKNQIDVDMPFGEKLKLWDEFSPSMYQLNTSVIVDGSEEKSAIKSIPFGLRDLRIDNKHFTVNGSKIFLRGNLECCIFPLTGYPPMDVDVWLRLYKVAQSYGLNHIRFHSWCPPEAAFVAADQLGVMLQVELPHWTGWTIGNIGSDSGRGRFLYEEADRILETYGNHPSFYFLSLGNELGTKRDTFLEGLVDHCKQKDSRRFYTSSTGISGDNRGDEFLVRQSLNDKWIRGMTRPNVIPCTDFDFKNLTAEVNVPIITHEIGQYLMYPNFDEIKKYTGHLKPLNFDVFRQSLKEHNMLDQAEDFRRATGMFQVQMYKEEVEAIFRTPNSAGFQLLGIQDFPGQGVALIGFLDPFWDSKGLIKPEEFRHFCSSSVPLLRMEKREWTSAETFIGSVELFHYGKAGLENVVPQWSISDAQGKQIGEGKFDAVNIPAAGVNLIGKISFDLSKINAAQKLTVSVSVKGTDIANSWNIWVYPAKIDSSIPEDIVVADVWNNQIENALADGKKVLLIAPKGRFKTSLTASFYPVFWSTPLFPNQPTTMGIFCNPKHPALAKFPTDFHSDWQWFNLNYESEAIILDDTPADFRPIVQFISEYNHNNKLGAIFEAKVGKGRLMVSSLDLKNNLEKRLAAKQLLYSIITYMQSKDFQPSSELGIAALRKIFTLDDITNAGGNIKDVNDVVINVKAADNIPQKEVSQPWQWVFDRIVKKDEGFDYWVEGGAWRDQIGCGWHNTSLIITLGYPKEFKGKLWVNFADWNAQKRSAAVFINGKDFGTVSDIGIKGKWVPIPVSQKDLVEGKLVLRADLINGPNVMISQIVLVKE